METSATMTKKRRHLGELPEHQVNNQADDQDHLDRCWSGKSLSTPGTGSASCYPSVTPTIFFTSLYMLVTWLY
jgi:hypothetical protein